MCTSMGASTSILLKTARGDWVKQYVRWPEESLTAVTDQYVETMKYKGPVTSREDGDVWCPRINRSEWFAVFYDHNIYGR